MKGNTFEHDNFTFGWKKRIKLLFYPLRRMQYDKEELYVYYKYVKDVSYIYGYYKKPKLTLNISVYIGGLITGLGLYIGKKLLKISVYIRLAREYILKSRQQ